MSSAMENKRKQKKTIEMNKVTTKMEIEQDYNNNDNTQSNSTINPLAIQTPTFNSKSLRKMNSNERSRAISINSKNIAQSVAQNLSCEIRFGQYTILLIMLLISITHFIIFHVYSNVHRNF